MKRRGFTLSEMLIVLAVIAIVSAVTLPMLTIKKKMKDFEANTLKCVRTELASSLNSAACTIAISKAQYGQENVINTLSFLVNNGLNASEKTASRKILSTACNNGGDKACSYFVKACQRDYSLCDTTGTATGYDLRRYLELMPNTNDSSKFLIYDQAKPLYDMNNTNIRTIVDNTCCPNLNIACFISGCTSCPWAKKYGGGAMDAGYSIAISGNYIYVTGSEQSDTSPNYDVFVMQLKISDGSCIWKKRYGGDTYPDNGQSIVVSPDGNYLYITGGESSDPVNNGQMFVMKLNTSDGSSVWKNHYGGATNDVGYAVAISGNYLYVTGSEASDAASVQPDVFVMQLNAADGTTLWKKHYGGAAMDVGNSIVVSGSYAYISGYIGSDTAGSWDIYVMQVNTSDGTAVWKKHYGGAQDDEGMSVAVSGSYVYITGFEKSDTAGLKDVFVMKLNTSDGTTVWKKHYGGAQDDAGNSIAISGSYAYVTGYEASDTPGTNDIFLMQLDISNGSVVTKKRYGGGGSDSGKALVISGNYLYTLGTQNSDTTGPVYVMKLNLNQSTSSNITSWTANGVDMGGNWTSDGVAMNPANWTADGTAMGGNWTSDGVAMNPTNWTADGVALGGSWIHNGVAIKKTTNGTNYWITGLKADGLPLP